ncbi:MAG: beta-glucuronidase [Calditrichaeota bacterium]|nr:beta-glucuronidase [Calditrichota bacterium]
MLYPQNNRCRVAIDLSDFWEIKVPKQQDENEENFFRGFEADSFCGVPGSWNEQLAERGLMNYIGKIYYQKEFVLSKNFRGNRILLRFGSADYRAKVWVNGKEIGGHEGGFLPFTFDITNVVDFEQANLIVVCVDNSLNHDTIPQGVTQDDYLNFHKARHQTFPPTVFDFLTFGGLNRPVKIAIVPEKYFTEFEVKTSIEGSVGMIEFKSFINRFFNGGNVSVSLWEKETQIQQQKIELRENMSAGDFVVKNCHFWSPDDPFLYKLKFELFENSEFVDEYSLEVGVREISWDNNHLYLNKEKIFLRGFGKHEDFPVLGKGLSFPVIVKDFQLMKWIGANSFRTSHYPYAEEIMQLADRMGFLVIAEVPAVSLNFRFVTEKTLENHKKALRELITRDRNHPCVIGWSVANEPGIWGEDESNSEKSHKYWQEIFQYTRELDPTRPLTLPTYPHWKEKDPVYKYCDIISLNRYWGWYEIPSDLDKVEKKLKAEIQKLHDKYDRPILMTEFGADTIEGLHATYPQLFTEEYQTSLIMKYFEVIESFPFTVGEHIWNFADFRTAQHFRRVVLNKKGVFNRQRDPKSAAFVIRKHWRGEK